MMITAALAIGGILALILYLISNNKSPLLKLPGPSLTPIIGNILQIDSIKPFLSLNEMAQKYGSIFKLKLFDKFIVVVNDFNSIHHVLVKKSSHFDGRPKSYRFNYLNNSNDIASIDAGPEVKGRRKTVQRFLKQFGSGMERIEAITNDAAEKLIQQLGKSKDEAVDMQIELFDVLTDLVTVLLNGNPCNDSDKKEIMDGVMAVGDALKGDVSGQMLDLFPFLRHFGNNSYGLMNTINQMKNKYIIQWINEKPEVGFMNYVLSMSEEEKKSNYLFDLEAQINVFFQFFAAGTLTTSTTLACLINALCHYPLIQVKLQKEVMAQIGSSRSPKMSDKNEMPYHRATMLEAARYFSIVPFSVPHKSTQISEIEGYEIPKGTEVWTNLWTLHHDDQFWDQPFVFSPERYLDENGDLVPVDHPNRRHTIPFGAGNRVCVGEIFAQSRMFLFLASLMQRFTILPETDLAKQPSCDPRNMQFGLVSTPPPFKVRFEPVN